MEGEGLLLRNENGLTLLEGIVSLGLILFVSSSFIPLMANMLLHINEGKKEVIAYRLMHEHVEKQAAVGTPGNARIVLHDTVFDLYIEENHKGEWKVCANYEEKTICVD